MFLALKKRLLTASIQTAIGLILSIGLLEARPAHADYQPPSEPSAPSGGTSTAGTRGGCSGNPEAGLTVLAPLSYAGQTVSTRPTFIWFVTDMQSYPLEFRLYQEGSGKRQLLRKVQMQSQSGLMKFSLPPSQPELQPGKLYSWQVILTCNPNHPSQDLVAGATLQILPFPATLRSQLNSAKSEIERAELYAKNSFWYDAIAEVTQPNPSIAIKQLQHSLLNDLAKSEKETPQLGAIIQEQKARLQQLAILK